MEVLKLCRFKPKLQSPNGCFHKLAALFVGAFVIRDLVTYYFGVDIRAPDFWKLLNSRKYVLFVGMLWAPN